MLLFLLGFPHIDWDWLGSLSPYGFVGIIVAVLAPVAFFLFWLEERIRVRKVWWSLGALAWIGCFALALSGYISAGLRP